MNAEAFALVVFFSILFLLAQIRFFRRFISLKKSYDNLPGALFLAESIGEGCFLCFDCCLWASGESERVDVLGDEHLEKYSGKAPDDHEIKLALEDRKKTDMSYLSAEEEQTKVKDLVSKRQKTSLMYISNITLLPQERIIEIILDDPDFIIEYEYVVNKKFLAKEEMTKKLCPICKTPYEPSHEFCSNCGNILN